MVVLKTNDLSKIKRDDICIEFIGSRLNNIGWEYKFSKILSALKGEQRFVIFNKKSERTNLKISFYDSTKEDQPETDEREINEIIRDISNKDHYLVIEDLIHAISQLYAI